MQVHVGDAPELLRAGHLAVDDAAAVILAWMGSKGLFVGIQHHIKARVADGVNRHLHAVLIGKADHRVKRILVKQRIAAGGRIVGVGPGEIGGPGAQCAVAEHLQRSDLEIVCAGAGCAAFGVKLLQIVQCREVALLVDADGEQAFLLEFLVRFVDRLPRNSPEHAVVVGLAAGDAIAVELPAGCFDHFLDLGFVRHRDLRVHILVHRVVREDAVQVPVLVASDGTAFRVRCVVCDAHQLDGLRVDGQDMAAGARHADRDIGRNLIQIRARRHALHIGEVILIPAAALKPCAVSVRMLCLKTAQISDHIGQTLCVLVKSCGSQRVSVGQQVHMAVVERRHNKAAAKIDCLGAGRRRKDLFIAACSHDPSAFRHKSCDEGQRSGVYLSVKINCLAHFPSFTTLSS